MRRVCSICELVMDEGEPGDVVSHGYCRVCFELMQVLCAGEEATPTTYSTVSPTGPELKLEDVLEAMRQFKEEMAKIPDVGISKLKRWPNGLTLIEVRVGLPDDQDWLNTLLKDGFHLVKAEFPMCLKTLRQREREAAQAYRLRKVAQLSQGIYEELERLVRAQEESPFLPVKP